MVPEGEVKLTGEYYQADERVRRELVPPEWIPPHTSGAGEGKAPGST